MRKFMSISTVMLLLMGFVYVGSGNASAVCRNNPNHWKCAPTTTTTTTLPTTTTIPTTTTVPPTTTQPTTTTTVVQATTPPVLQCINGQSHATVGYKAPGDLVRVDLNGDLAFSYGDERDNLTPTNPLPVTHSGNVLWDIVHENGWVRITNGVLSPISCGDTTTTTTPVPTTTVPTTTTTTTLPTTTTTTTTIPSTTTTTVPNPTRQLLWTGNVISDWYSVANSGGGTQRDTAQGVEQMLPALNGSSNSGARLNHQGFGSARVLPTEAWYSVEILVPTYQGAQNNVFQFKQGRLNIDRVHLWNIGWRPVNGELVGMIRTRLAGNQWSDSNLQDPNTWLDWTVPIGEWFHIEVFRRISTGSDGRYEIRIDGELVYTFNGPTAASNLDPRPQGNHEWVLSHYLGTGYYTDGPVGATSVFFRNAKIEQ